MHPAPENRTLSRWPISITSTILAAALVSCATFGGAVALAAQDRDPSEQATSDIRATVPGAQPEATASEASRSVEANCPELPNHAALTQALREIVDAGNRQANGGLGNHMWAVVVERSGAICAITHSGEEFGDQWPGSRAIAAQKAFTANAFSLPGFALSTANLFWPAQPENSLYALSTSNPVDPDLLYRGPPTEWGTAQDPLVGHRSGGTTVFGGGLALYTPEGKLIGSLGVSGDQSCTDHVIAWKLRHKLNFDNVPAGPTENGTDNIIYDLTRDPGSGEQTSASGYGHPVCGPTAKRIATGFSSSFPTGPEQ